MQYDINPEIPLVILLSGCACMSPVTPKYRNKIRWFINDIDDDINKSNLPGAKQDDTLVVQRIMVQRALPIIGFDLMDFDHFLSIIGIC